MASAYKRVSCHRVSASFGQFGFEIGSKFAARTSANRQAAEKRPPADRPNSPLESKMTEWAPKALRLPPLARDTPRRGLFSFGFGNLAIFSSAFPPADAIRAFGQVASNVDLGVGSTKIPCKLPRSTYLFGYDLVGMQNGQGTGRVGRICRDILNRE